MTDRIVIHVTPTTDPIAVARAISHRMRQQSAPQQMSALDLYLRSLAILLPIGAVWTAISFIGWLHNV